MKTKILLTIALIISFMTAVVVQSSAQPQEKQYYEIDLTGQLTHSEYGSPISGHTVYITCDTSFSGVMNYYKEVITDEDGFYHDTLTTTLTSGTVFIYTYNYYGEKLEDTLHYRFLDANNSNTFITNFSVFVPYQAPLLQARFSFRQTATENKFMYSFIDETKNENIISWDWDFGDGTVATVQNPVHTYPATGTYKIKLTVKAYVNDHLEINSIKQYLYIGDRSYYHMGGHCFDDHLFPIDKGTAYLFRIEITNQLTPIDTASIDTLGYYYFYQIPEGNYYVKAQPSANSKYFGTHLPTYYGDNIYWENAKIIEHNKTNWEYDVHLVKGLGINSGSGKISGSVVQTQSSMNPRKLSVENVDIILYDVAGSPLICTYTDSEGLFNLDDLPLNTYYLGAEIAGVPQQKSKIELTEENQEYDDIVIDLNTGDITLDINENQGNGQNILGVPYPNPASTYINCPVKMNHSGTVAVGVVNSRGQVVFSETVTLPGGNLNVITLNTSQFENGIYFIRVITDNQVGQQRFIASK